MAKDKRLNGKVALVTGGARGIGLAIATRFVTEGAKVVIGDIDGAEASAAAAALGSASEVLGHGVDITKEEQVAATVGETESRFGRLDILVNNAAILDMTTWDELTYTRFQEVLRVNLDG
ncbi:MAG: SDR family NAD(P)-dependent oxidoreductase, partial [Geminicoccales bacterium]